MIYKYDCGNETIDVFRSNNEFSNKVSVETYKNGKYMSYDRTIREDDLGKFFTWNKKKIYLDNFKKISIQTIKDKLANNEWITDDELCQAIMSEGIENVKFIIPMALVSCRFMGLLTYDYNQTIDKLCHIEESFNRKVSDCYKFTFVPDEYDGTTCSKEDKYVVDIISSLQSGDIKIL